MVNLPEIIHQDLNKLVLKVQSHGNPETFYNVTIIRKPPRIFCNCIGGKTNKLCHHMKDVKGYTDAFIKKRIDTEIGKAVKSYVYHSISKKELGEKQEIVKNCLLEHKDGLTDKGISSNTKLSLSCVTGRRNELMHMGIVEAYTIHTYDDKDGKTFPNIVWGLSNVHLEAIKNDV